MISIYGIILLEKTQIIVRMYEVNKKEWKLIHYENLPATPEEMTAKLATFFTTQNAKYVSQWKAGARGFAQSSLNRISSSLGLEIDNLLPLREQELLCKGLFTELW